MSIRTKWKADGAFPLAYRSLAVPVPQKYISYNARPAYFDYLVMVFLGLERNSDINSKKYLFIVPMVYIMTYFVLIS